jgi:ketosteroid isomerase-like protein
MSQRNIVGLNPLTAPMHLISRLLAFALLCLLIGCTRTPSEKLLLETMAQMQQAGEAGDVSALMSHVADDFSGQSASMDRRGLGAYLLAIKMRSEKIGVTRPKTSVTLDGNRAKVEISMLVTDGGRILPAQGQYVSATTQWRFADGEWQLASANWNEGL